MRGRRGRRCPMSSDSQVATSHTMQRATQADGLTLPDCKLSELDASPTHIRHERRTARRQLLAAHALDFGHA